MSFEIIYRFKVGCSTPLNSGYPAFEFWRALMMSSAMVRRLVAGCRVFRSPDLSETVGRPTRPTPPTPTGAPSRSRLCLHRHAYVRAGPASGEFKCGGKRAPRTPCNRHRARIMKNLVFALKGGVGQFGLQGVVLRVGHYSNGPFRVSLRHLHSSRQIPPNMTSPASW